jgi:hypothetical protein
MGGEQALRGKHWRDKKKRDHASFPLK